MRLRVGQGVAGLQQRAGQGQFRAVDGEDAVAEPAGAGLVGAAQDLGMELAEDLRVDLAPGADHGRFGDRDRLPDRMGQRHYLRPVLPQSRLGPLRNASLCCISTPIWALS